MKKRGKKIVADWEDEEQEEIIWVSKSEIKRDAEELKKLGAKLVELTKTNLEKIPMPENLADAVELARRLQKEARRRQLQYIGKLLRAMDTEPIREALDKIENKHNQQQALLHKLELLRDELVEKGDSALGQVLETYPRADRQHLRNLIRQAQKERAQKSAPKAYREIYRYLSDLLLQE
ncbi:ribosome-associated protein [Mesocricetibacter intestinalis]|uniref:Dual-action ribosomal maturation protein DarP n=1 Tax=Mesocricetibacter intestinalis TaxID=1521930 RepID=A0A4R6VC20_9PAST|nr:ribosome biogenesis factor YjgA [Mesocricetibacter intestinalis]TDQ59787.1 ribosome-associated protein [Mesocricetibacter intestinalis]